MVVMRMPRMIVLVMIMMIVVLCVGDDGDGEQLHVSDFFFCDF